MYADIRNIRTNVVKLSLNDDELNDLVDAITVSGEQKASLAREMLMLGIKYKLFEYANAKRLDQILEGSEKLQQAA
jgi:hypothetical protein